MNKKVLAKFIRQKRTRSKISGTANCPRLSIFRSNAHIFGQLIDDVSGKTLVSFSDLNIKNISKKTLTEKSRLVGVELAKKAKVKKISKAVFDRGSYKYHGIIKALADGAREGGIKF